MAPPNVVRKNASSAPRKPSQREASPGPTAGKKACVAYLHANPLVKAIHGTDGRITGMKEMNLLQTNEELKLVVKKLRGSRRHIEFQADIANVYNLRKILDLGCKMLHYAGHANDSSLGFESSVSSECGIVEPLEVAPLKRMLEAGGVTTQLVYISTCCSEVSGNAFVEAGVPHVVAVKKGHGVSDRAALQFSDLFYDALFSNKGTFTVLDAYETALRTVDASKHYLPEKKGDHFLLLPRDGNHDVRIFDTLPEGDFIDLTRVPPPRPPCAKAVSSYRDVVGLQNVIKLLVDPRQHPCVTITGERGSGKTERAIQACDYVRERRLFDVFHWADCNELEEAEVGIAVGMPFPGPNSEAELHRFLFKSPANGGRQPCKKALLVLENADALLERGGDARLRLGELLSSLCSMGDDEHLKLLVTSEQRLLARFRHGAEVEAKVEPLKPVDASKFLIDKLPRTFTRGELDLPGRVALTSTAIRNAVQNHPQLMDVIKEGHPGTLQRLAPTLLDDLRKGKLKETAVRCRNDFRVMPRRRPRCSWLTGSTASITSFNSVSSGLPGASPLSPPGLAGTPPPPHGSYDTHTHHLLRGSRGGGGGSRGSFPVSDGSSPARAASCGDPPGARMGAATTFQPIRADGHGLQRHRTDGGCTGRTHHGSSFGNNNQRIDHGYPQPPSLEQSPPPPPPPCQHVQERSRMAAMALAEPEPPCMDEDEQRAWKAAVEAEVDPGCILVWVVATADASADEASPDDDDDRPHRSGATAGKTPGGLGSTRGEQQPRQDGVPWETLCSCLVDHYGERLTVPNSQRAKLAAANDGLNEGVYGDIAQTSEEEEENDESERDGESEGGEGWYERIDSDRQARRLSVSELAFIRDILKKKQDILRAHRPRSGAGARGRRDGGGAARRVDADMVYVEEFAAFSLWWAAVMRTRSLIRRDWEATEPVVRVRGFIRRLDTDKELKEQTPGTFLLRFSETVLGVLVVSFREHVCVKRVKHCLVEVSEEGCRLMEGPQTWHASLRDLVMEASALTTLYPDIPKEIAFDEETLPSAEGQERGGGGGAGVELGATSDSKGEGGEAPMLSQSTPPPGNDFKKTPADAIAEIERHKRNGEEGCGESKGVHDLEIGWDMLLPANEKIQRPVCELPVPQFHEDGVSTPAEGAGRRSDETGVERGVVGGASTDAVDSPTRGEIMGLMPPPLYKTTDTTPVEGEQKAENNRACRDIDDTEAVSETSPDGRNAAPPEGPKTSTYSQCPSLGRGKEVLTTRLECGLGEVALKSDVHALQLVVPNLEHAVNASIFVDNSASSTVIDNRMHIILPIVTCGPAGLSFAQPLRLRFDLCGTEEASESSDVDSTESTCSVGSDDRSRGSGDGREQCLRCSYKVVMQKGGDRSSKDWTVLDGTLVSEGDDLFLEANISHFCRFGLAQEVDRYGEGNGGYIEADLAKDCKRKGTATFVNLSDRHATFYLQPKLFDTKRQVSGGVSVLEKLSASFSKRVDRTPLATETTLFTGTLQLGPGEHDFRRIGESVGSEAAVAVTTSERQTVSGWFWQGVSLTKVSVWDKQTAKERKALILLNKRFLPTDTKYPTHGHFTVNVADEAEANIAQKVHDAITIISK